MSSYCFKCRKIREGRFCNHCGDLLTPCVGCKHACDWDGEKCSEVIKWIEEDEFLEKEAEKSKEIRDAFERVHVPGIREMLQALTIRKADIEETEEITRGEEQNDG